MKQIINEMINDYNADQYAIVLDKIINRVSEDFGIELDVIDLIEMI